MATVATEFIILVPQQTSAYSVALSAPWMELPAAGAFATHADAMAYALLQTHLERFTVVEVYRRLK